MKTCPACRRHALPSAAACPFCDRALPTTRSAPALGLVVGVAMTACAPSIAVEDDGEADSATETTSGPPGTTSGPSATTAMPSTSSSGAGTSFDTGEAESSSSSGFDTASDDDNGASSVGFYGGPADWGTVAMECDIWQQDCPDGEKCAAWANDGGAVWNATRCAPLDPSPDEVGEACTVEGSGVSGIDSCELGSMCYDVDPDTNVGTCVAWCTGSEAAPICEDPSTTCNIIVSDVLALCLEA